MTTAPIAARSASPRAVLVTSTSTGIGYACVQRLARRGFLVLAGVRNAEDARRIEASGSETASGIHALLLDVTNSDSIHAAAVRARELVGDDGLCGLVNNAGVCVVGPAECLCTDDWRQQFEVNFFGPVAMTQAMLPLLRSHVAAHGRGAARIVNINSITGRIATPLFGAYSSSKAALQSFTDALRLELQGQGIHVCSLVPGTIQSEIWRKEKAGVDAISEHPLAKNIYQTLIKNTARYVFGAAETAKPAELVAAAVERCLTARRPPIKQLIAWEAQVGWRAKTLLPDRLLDFLMSKTLGIPRR